MNNRKIIYEPDNISSEEIKNRRDFDTVISSLKKPPSPFWKLTGFWGTVGTSIVALLIYNNYFLKTDENQNTAYDENITQTINNQSSLLPEDTKCLHPLNETNDIPFESFEVASNSDQKITLKDGSVISIASNTFLTNSDAPIEIKARTFSSKSEAFLAGVPMDYNNQAFESAGMIEIRGTQNGEVVKINPESPVEVSLALYKDPSTFNFYQLDDNSGRWTEYPVDYTGTNNSAEVAENVSILEAEIKVNDSKIEEIDKQIGLVKLPKRRAFNLPLENSNVFNLKYDPLEFPELEELGDVQFEALPDQSNYNKVLQHVWSNFELKDLKEGVYEVEFSNNRGLEEKLYVRPVLQGNEFDKAFAEFSKLYNAKVEKRTSLEQEKEALIEANKKRNKRLIELQKEHELSLVKARNERTQQYEAENKQRNAVMLASAEFNTTSWGLFNSDKPISYPNPIGTPSTYRMAGKDIIPNEIYVFDLKKDVRYSYGKGTRIVESIGMNNNETIFIVMGENNQIGYFRANSKKDFQEQQIKSLTVINRNQINVEFFKRLLEEERVQA